MLSYDNCTYKKRLSSLEENTETGDRSIDERTALGIGSAEWEVSLVVVKAGQDAGTITSAMLPILGVVTIVTTFMTPYILTFGSKLGNVSR